MLFSQRQGLKPVIKDLQVKEMDLELRNRLWNLLNIHYWKNYKHKTSNYVHGSNLEALLNAYWHSFFKWPIDEIPSNFYTALSVLKDEFYKFQWNQVFDFIEFTIKVSDYEFAQLFATLFVLDCNKILEEENSAYRIIDNQLVEITSVAELESIEEALNNSIPFPGVNTHLSSAIQHLSNREHPDYRNSIKESISAVEAICQIITGDKSATLGKALNILERQMNLHGALKAGFSSLYGYTSDAEGIRHALLDEPTLTFVDAKYMLVTCTAFINYILGHVAMSGIKLEH